MKTLYTKWQRESSVDIVVSVSAEIDIIATYVFPKILSASTCPHL
jgi:hypothetical protein